MENREEPIEQVLKTIRDTFEERGSNKYGIEDVTQLQHALQSAMLAEEAESGAQQISAALIHDIGHIMHKKVLPSDVESNLDDRHEERAYGWIKRHFGVAVADPVRLHVAAKRYLCTVDSSYTDQLSPTSYKSFLDQGGEMNHVEQQEFEQEPLFREAVQLRKWDDLAKDASKETPPFAHFESYLREALNINYSL